MALISLSVYIVPQNLGSAIKNRKKEKIFLGAIG
jgi:hypothetical protein